MSKRKRDMPPMFQWPIQPKPQFDPIFAELERRFELDEERDLKPINNSINYLASNKNLPHHIRVESGILSSLVNKMIRRFRTLLSIQGPLRAHPYYKTLLIKWIPKLFSISSEINQRICSLLTAPVEDDSSAYWRSVMIYETGGFSEKTNEFDSETRNGIKRCEEIVLSLKSALRQGRLVQMSL